ncbi:MAG: hypothetical protein ACLQVL_04885 [Terriglobia bacterium]
MIEPLGVHLPFWAGKTEILVAVASWAASAVAGTLDGKQLSVKQDRRATQMNRGGESLGPAASSRCMGSAPWQEMDVKFQVNALRE